METFGGKTRKNETQMKTLVQSLLFLALLVTGKVAAEGAECPFPGIPYNAIMSSSTMAEVKENTMNPAAYDLMKNKTYTTGSTFEIRCEEGFHLEGSSIRTCTQNGNWTGDPPQCMKSVMYEIPGSSQNNGPSREFRLKEDGHVNYVNIYFQGDPCSSDLREDIVKIHSSNQSINCTRNVSDCSKNSSPFLAYFCPTSKDVFRGDSTLVKFSSSAKNVILSKSQVVFHPEENQCGYPEGIINGNVFINETGHYAATYECNDEFHLIGPKKRSCEDGKWTGQPPICIPSEQNGTVLNTTAVDSTVLLTENQKLLIIVVTVAVAVATVVAIVVCCLKRRSQWRWPENLCSFQNKPTSEKEKKPFMDGYEIPSIA